MDRIQNLTLSCAGKGYDTCGAFQDGCHWQNVETTKSCSGFNEASCNLHKSKGCEWKKGQKSIKCSTLGSDMDVLVHGKLVNMVHVLME